MRVVKNFNKNYDEDPIRFFDFEQYENIAKDITLYIGSYPHDSIFESGESKKIFFSTEEQTWDKDSTDRYLNHVEKILTICPPKITNRQKREFVFFPFNKNFIPGDTEKKYDAIYTGYATGPHIDVILNSIKKFDYRFVSFSSIPGLTTDSNVSYLEKLNLISQSRCCVVHNLVSNGTPQLKSRPFEAAFCKSLMLVYKDNYNIIEDWFTPNEDFLYFDSESQLTNIISDVKTNYEKYENIISNAFEKSLKEYTTESFIQKYIGFK